MKIRVQISASQHPHNGEIGYIEPGEDGKVKILTPPGSKPAVKINLEHCAHGMTACYASPQELIKI